METISSLEGKPYNSETARHLKYGGIVNSKGIIVKVFTEEDFTTKGKVCPSRL